MKKFSKQYHIRELNYTSVCYSVTLSLSNRESHRRARIICNSVLYAVPTTEKMFTPEASRNRKYQIKQ